jgi:cytidylate kinase
MIISFGGSIGSGKSGVARSLAQKLGWPYYDMGDIRRKLAAERGMTLEELNILGESDPKTDTEVDEYQEKLGKEQDNFVISGRTSWHFIPHSLKIFLKVDPLIGAERVFKSLAGRNEADGLDSVETVLAANQRRVESDRLRYKKYFNIDVYDESHYDHVVDTSHITQNEAFERVCAIIEAINNKHL